MTRTLDEDRRLQTSTQRALLDALVNGASLPEGMDAERARLTAALLTRKRARSAGNVEEGA